MYLFFSDNHSLIRAQISGHSFSPASHQPLAHYKKGGKKSTATSGHLELPRRPLQYTEAPRRHTSEWRIVLARRKTAEKKALPSDAWRCAKIWILSGKKAQGRRIYVTAHYSPRSPLKTKKAMCYIERPFPPPLSTPAMVSRLAHYKTIKRTFSRRTSVPLVAWKIDLSCRVAFRDITKNLSLLRLAAGTLPKKKIWNSFNVSVCARANCLYIFRGRNCVTRQMFIKNKRRKEK